MAGSTPRSESRSSHLAALDRHQQGRAAGLWRRRDLRRDGGCRARRLGAWNGTWDAAALSPTGRLPAALAGADAAWRLRVRELSPCSNARATRSNGWTLTAGDAFPGVAADRYPDGYLNPRAGWVESGKVLERLTKGFRPRVWSYGRTRPRDTTDRAWFTRGRVELQNGVRFLADIVLVAAGAWTSTLIPELGTVMWATGQPVVHLEVARAGRMAGAALSRVGRRHRPHRLVWLSRARRWDVEDRTSCGRSPRAP